MASGTSGTHGKQRPYGIKGTVTLNGSNYQGAKIFLRDMTEGTTPSPVDDYTQVYTNSSGKYLINLAQSTASYSNGDTVVVYCQTGEIISTSTITVNTAAGYSTVNFTITRKSGLTDGAKRSGLSSGKGGLNRELIKGCSDGLK